MSDEAVIGLDRLKDAGGTARPGLKTSVEPFTSLFSVETSDVR